ncbi:hypothetical protein [Paraburkholderia atlantica]|uniref:hypothetical protein n=1 Tax=Paraburkholderia atlantica TaxID=2654982 RepID=UPI001620E6DC|nr:hypothetical protein [Paraburkholderia atlantica]MBB5414095.1 phage terminase Nu1 subunit (DNA packaging protein) [Paraburkholderia atlantica]
MNQAKFAELHGVSRKTVTKWKERGWLVFAGDQVDAEESNALLKKYRRDGVAITVTPPEGNAPGNKPVEVTKRAGESFEQAAVRVLTANGADMDLDEARRVKENYLALLNQLEYDEKAGAVVDATEVAAAVGSEYAKVRTRLLAIPAEQAPRVHRCKTVAEVQAVLQEIIVEALEELTRDGASPA